ncbi:DUF4369 domain-containing protein [Tellurirhabdus bombi]|uniref:DUF4369 domain-containing protein n=1 Tax=Tellurirhabdus bombi TaxID=2907205 RepID=UPI001F17CB04|nr:DUF4369 domain-containing protein [Tellurirhabdus bombi]
MKTSFSLYNWSLLVALLLTTNAFAQRTFRIVGNVPGLDNVTVYLKKTDNSNSKTVTVDLTKASQGTFKFERDIPEVDFYNIVVDGLPGQVNFVWDGNLTLEGTKEAFRESIVKGSPLTEQWLEFQNKDDRPYREILMELYNERHRTPGDTSVSNRVTREEKRLKTEQNKKVEERIRNNPNSLLSLYLLNWYWPQFPKAEARSLYDKLDNSFKTHSVAKRLQAQLK